MLTSALFQLNLSVNTASVHLLQSVLLPAIFLNSFTYVPFSLSSLGHTLIFLGFPLVLLPSGRASIIYLGFLSSPSRTICPKYFNYFIFNPPPTWNCSNSSLIIRFLTLSHLAFQLFFHSASILYAFYF